MSGDYADGYIGMTEADATRWAIDDGYSVRVTARDGQHYPVTRDYRNDRINFHISGAVVVNASVG